MVSVLTFCLQGLWWLAFSNTSHGFFHVVEIISIASLDFSDWAKWYFIATWNIYSCETISSFVADSKHPKKTLQFLTFASWLMPLIFLGCNWVLPQATITTGQDNTYLSLLAASKPFWGEFTSTLVTLLILRQQATELKHTLKELQSTQAQLIQSEKMSSLGQLVAGVAHEINNPVNFIYGNLTHIDNYAQDLLALVQLYSQTYPNPTPDITDFTTEIDLDFLQQDFPKTLNSMKVGAQRIREIVLTLRNFSRLDEADMKPVDIHQGIDSTLLILQHHLQGKPGQPEIEVIKKYGNLPEVECYAGQLNQVFMNILTNAIDALRYFELEQSKQNLQHHSQITICTRVKNSSFVTITIKDNGLGMTSEVKTRLFDPFFTTKPVGKGTGLGLSICYQIVVDKHGGKLECLSQLGKGTEFLIEIPIKPNKLLATKH